MKGFKSSLFSLCILSLLAGCTKIDTTDIGSGLIPSVDNVQTFETILGLVTENKLVADTTRMLDGEPHAIGLITNDPEFGKTEATSYISFTPSAIRSYPFVKRDTVIIDSVVLSLAYSSTFGDSNAIQQFEVREIDNRFTKFEDSLYRIDANDFPVHDDMLGSAQVQFSKLNDSVRYRNARDTIRTTNELRIQLDTAWARRFVNYDTTSESAYNNDTTFQDKFFAGVQIKSAEGQGSGNALAYFSLIDNERTRITFYCRVQNNGRTDTIAPFFHHTFDRQANIIRRTPANGYLTALNNTVENDDVLYLQPSPGSSVEISVQGMDTFRTTNRIIHRAELILEKYPSQDLSYSAPPLIFIEAISTTGDSIFTIRNDFVRINQNPGYDVTLLGGIYRNNQYVFNLSRYIQSIVTKGFTDYKLRVYAPFYTQPYYIEEGTDKPTFRTQVFVNTPIAANRVVLYGGGSADPKRARLRIIYSEL